MKFVHDQRPSSGTYQGIVYDSKSVVCWENGDDTKNYRLIAKTGLRQDTPVRVIIDGDRTSIV